MGKPSHSCGVPLAIWDHTVLPATNIDNNSRWWLSVDTRGWLLISVVGWVATWEASTVESVRRDIRQDRWLCWWRSPTGCWWTDSKFTRAVFYSVRIVGRIVYSCSAE